MIPKSLSISIKAKYQMALAYWPREIDVSDGRMSDNGGFISENLSRAWSEAEEKAAHNEWEELLVWVIYKLLHEKAKLRTERIFPNQIDVGRVKSLLKEELQQEQYESMLEEFKKYNSL